LTEMKRSRGITLLVLFLLLFAAYVLWSALPFFLGAKLKFQGSIPPEAKRLIEELYTGADGGQPEPFSIRVFFHLLSHPYEGRVPDLVVTRESPTSIKVNQSGHGVFSVTLKDGQWQMVWDTLY